MNQTFHNWQSQAIQSDDALSLIQSGAKVFIHGASATPIPLVQALTRYTGAEEVTTYHLHINGVEELGSPDVRHIRPVSLFTGAHLRKPINQDFADHVPIFRLMHRRTLYLFVTKLLPRARLKAQQPRTTLRYSNPNS